MSTSPHQSGEQRVSPPTLQPDGDRTAAERAVAFFEATIWHDPHVCSHCFTRVKRGPSTASTGESGDETDSWRTPDGVLGVDLEDPPEAALGVKPVARPRTTCGSCGSVGALAQADTLSRREALGRVPALCARLDEQGYDVAEATVRRTVRHLKGQPAYASDDKRIFATAVALGIDRD